MERGSYCMLAHHSWRLSALSRRAAPRTGASQTGVPGVRLARASRSSGRAPRRQAGGQATRPGPRARAALPCPYGARHGGHACPSAVRGDHAAQRPRPIRGRATRPTYYTASLARLVLGSHGQSALCSACDRKRWRGGHWSNDMNCVLAPCHCRVIRATASHYRWTQNAACPGQPYTNLPKYLVWAELHRSSS
jgi:hypothetical protein